MAIRAVGDIIEDYDTDKLFPTLGDTKIRVTGLGELSPIGHFFNLAIFLIAQSGTIFGGSTEKSYALIFDKKWVGLHFGRFFYKLVPKQDHTVAL
jgi:hypothetical protein